VEVLTGADLDSSVAARGADEPPDGPADAVLVLAGDGEGGEHDGQARVDGFAFVVVNRLRAEVVFDIRKLFSIRPSWW
jgi:hypothetical protein